MHSFHSRAYTHILPAAEQPSNTHSHTLLMPTVWNEMINYISIYGFDVPQSTYLWPCSLSASYSTFMLCWNNQKNLFPTEKIHLYVKCLVNSANSETLKSFEH